MNKKITWSLAILVVLILVGGVGFISNPGLFNNSTILQALAQQPDSAILQDVVIREERVYICGDVQEVARRTVGSLNIKTEQELSNQYAAKGYSVVKLKNDFLAQTKVNDFCNYHNSFRHFGIQNNKLAIFQGPLGYNQKLICIEENIDINTLQPTFQVKLQQAMDFFQMNPETQAKLRYELEFSSEDGLNAALENLDELQE
ncbi:hypothetical protein [Desulforamulus aeronauticus]|uniref:BofC C-terminal domain-containing protein n=1 Tax=Desulforamulus aeronauticus DSM 10349 TaxID=1121421 RepID=A0A1M6NMK6_9FIRM|nr:hypothetical protein [Desulforamulus aeronauticus]SHJ96969.1 hypothetical protein SAMN02745123_00227 [Desulforamulus aeronauticus DSM 10349]